MMKMDCTGNLYAIDNNFRPGNQKLTKYEVVQYIPDHHPDF